MKTVNEFCVICKKVFTTINRGSQIRTCSKKCRKILRRQQNQTILKLGQYKLDKKDFILYNLNNKKLDKKKWFEYTCTCKNVFVTSVRHQTAKEQRFKWLCRSCVMTEAWKNNEYKKKHIEGCVKSFTKERRDFYSKQLKKLWTNVSFRKKVLEEVLCNDEMKKKSMHFSHISRRRRYIISDKILRSTYEYRFAKVLNENNIKWQYEFKRFKILYENSKYKNYYPDFYLPEYDLLIEIKGYWFEGQKEKFKKFQEQYPNIKIKVFYEQQIQTIEKRDLSEIIK